MEKLIKLVIVLFITVNTFSQETTPIVSMGVGHSYNVDFKNSPGDELKLYTRRFYTGTNLSLIGAGLVYIGSLDPQHRKPITVIGSVIGLVGLGFALEAPRHIKRAGILLNQNGVGVQIKI